MNKDTKPFLNDGLNVYPEARATLTFFEQEVGKLLSTAVARREGWEPLKNHKVNSPKVDGTSGQGGYWVAMFAEGMSASNEMVKIDFGIWWQAIEGFDQPIVYASFYEIPERLIKFKWNHDKQDIRCFERWNRSFLYLPVTDSDDIGLLLNMVLNELLKLLL
ncbi:MAG TPA: hypothetical protein VGI03_15690 [Verrucomicrobiae bacterium]|jgi:hypothetical protein